MASHMILPQEQQNDLVLLLELPSEDIIQEFAKSSIQFLKNAPQNLSLTFQKVATHLKSISKQHVEQTIKALSNLFATATRKGLTEEALITTLKTCFEAHPNLQSRSSNVSVEDTIKILASMYIIHKEELAPLFKEQRFGNHYVDLKWRLETQLASRRQKSIITPRFSFQLQTTDSEEPITFQINQYSELKRITEKLDNAVKDLKTPHAKRIKTYIH